MKRTELGRAHSKIKCFANSDTAAGIQTENLLNAQWRHPRPTSREVPAMGLAID